MIAFFLHYLVSVNFPQPGGQSTELTTDFVNESFHQTEGMNNMTFIDLLMLLSM